MIYITHYLQCFLLRSSFLLYLVVNVVSVSCLCLCDYFANFADSLYASNIYVACTIFIVFDCNVVCVSFFLSYV